MYNLLWSAALATVCLSAPAFAENGPVVVELFTSQGCSACPPADEMLAELSTRDDVIALALHVDYWDYIGWADQFADPMHTRRQQGYAHAAGETTIYTPQFVVAGQDLIVGARGMTLVESIQAHAEIPLPVSITLERIGDMVAIEAEMVSPSDAGSVTYIVQLLHVMSAQTVDITRGENAGKSFTYSNIVRSLDVLDQWDGTAPYMQKAAAPGEDRVAVIIQAGANGPVVGAARID